MFGIFPPNQDQIPPQQTRGNKFTEGLINWADDQIPPQQTCGNKYTGGFINWADGLFYKGGQSVG
eukprot:4655252-Ditylum_brightwellii.AAC.1